MWLGHHFQGQKVKGQFAGGGGILWRPPAQVVVNNLTCALTTIVLSCSPIVGAVSSRLMFVQFARSDLLPFLLRADVNTAKRLERSTSLECLSRWRQIHSSPAIRPSYSCSSPWVPVTRKTRSGPGLRFWRTASSGWNVKSTHRSSEIPAVICGRFVHWGFCREGIRGAMTPEFLLPLGLARTFLNAKMQECRWYVITISDYRKILHIG